MTNQISLSGASDVRPKLSALIKDLCPNGVEFKTLGEVCIVKTAPMKLDKKEYHEEGLYPIVDQGQKQIIGYTDNEEALVPTDDYVIFGDHTREIKYVDFAFAQGADGVKILKAKDFLLPRFLYHALKNIQIPSRGYNRHWTIAKDFEIPLPPIEIQKKIVECLDKFSALAAELQAELQMRRKQYEYYRTQLLTPHSDCNSADKTDDRNWEWKTLGEISYSIKTGLNPRKFFKLNTEDAQNYYITIREMQNNHLITSDKTDMINDEALKLCLRRSNIKKDDLLFSGTGTIGQMYVVTETPTNWAIKEGIYVIKPKTEQVLTKFLYYILGSDSVRKSINDKVAGGIVKSIPMKELANISIPLPSLAEQERIVTLLDKFEALTTSLSDGIPAEQAAQQKRYEYYRDLLLTFPRKAV